MKLFKNIKEFISKICYFNRVSIKTTNGGGIKMVDNRELFEEVVDQDEDIRRKEALIEEAKQIEISKEWNEVAPLIMNLKKRWRKIPYWESAYEDTLLEEFDAVIDQFYAKRKESLANTTKIKEELIQRATELSKSQDWNKVTDEMNELMNQWKASGSVGNKEADDELWNKFSAARQTFFDRKHENWQQRKAQVANAAEVKREIVVKAQGLAESEEWKKTTEVFKELLEQWKAAGFAGKSLDDELWEQFQAARKTFYDRRNKHYDDLRAEFNEKYEQKKAIVDELKAIVDTEAYTRENTEKVKALNAKWKAVGSCGKEKEDAIWSEFRSAADAYFTGLKAFNEQRQAQWKNRMLENRNRKLELIEKQKRQLKWMEQELTTLLSQSAADDMEEDIEDKKAFIAELEEQLTELDAKISEK